MSWRNLIGDGGVLSPLDEARRVVETLHVTDSRPPWNLDGLTRDQRRIVDALAHAHRSDRPYLTNDQLQKITSIGEPTLTQTVDQLRRRGCVGYVFDEREENAALRATNVWLTDEARRFLGR